MDSTDAALECMRSALSASSSGGGDGAGSGAAAGIHRRSPSTSSGHSSSSGASPLHHHHGSKRLMSDGSRDLRRSSSAPPLLQQSPDASAPAGRRGWTLNPFRRLEADLHQAARVQAAAGSAALLGAPSGGTDAGQQGLKMAAAGVTPAALAVMMGA